MTRVLLLQMHHGKRPDRRRHPATACHAGQAVHACRCCAIFQRRRLRAAARPSPCLQARLCSGQRSKSMQSPGARRAWTPQAREKMYQWSCQCADNCYFSFLHAARHRRPLHALLALLKQLLTCTAQTPHCDTAPADLIKRRQTQE